MYCLFCVVFCIVCAYMCAELLPPAGYPIAVKYIISYHIIMNTVMQCSLNVLLNVFFLKRPDVSSGLLTWHLWRRIRTHFNAFRRYVTAYQAHYFLSDHHNNVWRKVKLMKLLYKHSPLCLYSFFFFRSNIPVSGLLSCVIHVFSFLIVTVFFFLQFLFMRWVFPKVEDLRFHNSQHMKTVSFSARRTVFLLATGTVSGIHFC
jgi:hypothetical protein